MYTLIGSVCRGMSDSLMVCACCSLPLFFLMFLGCFLLPWYFLLMIDVRWFSILSELAYELARFYTKTFLGPRLDGGYSWAYAGNGKAFLKILMALCLYIISSASVNRDEEVYEWIICIIFSFFVLGFYWLLLSELWIGRKFYFLLSLGFKNWSQVVVVKVIRTTRSEEYIQLKVLEFHAKRARQNEDGITTSILVTYMVGNPNQHLLGTIFFLPFFSSRFSFFLFILCRLSTSYGHLRLS